MISSFSWKRWLVSCFTVRPARGRTRVRSRRRSAWIGVSAMIEVLEARRLLTTSTVVFDPANGDQVVEVANDPDLGAVPIMVTVNGDSAVTGNQVRIYNAARRDGNDLRQVCVVDTNGYLRALHLDSDQPAGQQDGFGGSVVLGPTMVLSDGMGGGIFALSPQINAIDIVTPGSPNGDIVLNMSGTINSSGGPVAGLSVTWAVTIPNATPLVASASGPTTVRIEQQAHFATGVTLNSTAETNAEGFRVVRFSNSYVDAAQTSMNTTSHDADTALAYGSDGSLLSELNLATVSRGQLLASGGIAGATSIRLEQRRPSLLNDDPPNLTLRLVNPANPGDYRAQGFIGNSNVNENSDNVDWYINQQFTNPVIAAGTDLSWTIELTAEDGGDLLPQARFLHDQASQYTLSANPSDFGQPMIPIFTNANDRGMYLSDIFHGGVTDSASDPDAFRGRSSYRMTINTLGGNGFVVFEMGDSRPRDIPQIGLAHRLRFAAKGDTNGQQVEVRIQLADLSLVDLGAANIVTLSDTWAEYDIALPANIAASNVKGVHFLFVSTLPQGMGTVRLDEIRLGTDGFDPLRTLQSYVPLNSGGNTRDADFYHTAAFIYDNALAIKALLYTGDMESRQLARDIADGILMTQLPDGSFYDQLSSGHVATAGGVRGSFGERRAGDNLFLGLSLLELARAFPTDNRYYNGAVSIGNWLNSTLRAGGTLGGYYGGLDSTGLLLTYRATEHNLDAFEFYRQLADLAELLGDAASAPAWREHATHAGTFVIGMFDNNAIVANRKFWTGTQSGSDVINTSSVPGDVQFWAQQTLGQSVEFGGSADYQAAIDWAIANLSATDGSLIGFNFSSGAQTASPNHVWLEGTAHAAVSFALSGPSRAVARTAALETLRLARLTGVGNSGNPHDGLGVPAASRDTITDLSFAFLAFDDRLHVGASAWAFFATKGVSPFQPLLSVAPVITSFDTTAAYTASGAAVLLDSNATATDLDTTRFNGGQLTLSLTANAEANDRLNFRPVTRLIGVSGTNLTYRGTIIGSFSGGVGTADLVVTFNGNATESAVQTVLRNVTYRSVSANPSTAARTVRVTLTDGSGGTSNLPAKTINVIVPPLSSPFGASVATAATAPTGLPGVAPAGLLIYYAYPSGINGTFSVDGASAEFAQYPFVVLGEGLEQVGHPDHANTVAILNHVATADTTFFGYVDLGVSTSQFTTAEIHQRIDAWNASGADGIFLDDYGYDFGVSRERQNDAVDYAHSVGLPVVANGFFIDEVFGNQIDAEFNPGGVATHLESTDYYLYESYQIQNGSFVDEATWRAKADALAAVRATLPINVFAVTTNIGPSFEQNKFDYAYWSAALDGYIAFGWGEESFSSNTASAPYRLRPATDPGTSFSSPIDGTSQLFTRNTDAGRIAVDARGFKAGFNQVDFGDAPDTNGGTGPGNYQTTAANDGARHRVGGPRLGATVDFEAAPNVYLEGLVNQPYGYGDNTFGSDEEGVTFTSLLQSSPTAATSGTVVVNVQNAVGTARLDAWLDFNADGDWGDAGEHIFNNVAVVSGDNNLTFTVPMGAASGKTFARFRLSTAGNLAPLGLADDGEVEDDAVLIGGTSSLAVIENAILSHLLPSGVLRSGSGPSFYDRNNQPWYIVDPYFSTIAVRALLAAPNSASVDKFTVAANQLNFWLSHIQPVPSLPGDRNATIPRVIVDQNGSPLAANLTVDGTTDGGATYTTYNATMKADADDSALALILSLASEFKLSGGLASVLNAQQANLELVGNTLLSLIGGDGLARPFVDPSNTYTIKQTLDCVEVWQALRQFSVLERDLFLDASMAAMFAAQADAMSDAIQLLLVDQTSQLYRQYVGAVPPDLNTWYPIVLDQVWPIITGLIPANSPTARHLLDEVYAAWDGGLHISWTTRTDSGWLAWAAVQAGDTSLAAAAVQNILAWTLQNSLPLPTTVSFPNGNVPAMTVADLGFLLQALLPAVAGSSAITYTENDAATAISTGITASDVDSATLSSATVTLANFVPGEDVLSFTNEGATMGNIAEAGNAGGVLTLTSADSSATLAQWQAALRAVKYANGSDAPTTTQRSVTFAVSDGLASSNPVTSTISIVTANDAPVLTAPSAITFTENDAATAINTGLTVGDSDNAMLAGATVTLTAFVPGQDLLSFANDGASMGNIAAAGNANGVLTLISPGSTATTVQWQSALRAVKYSNSSDAPTTTQRSVTFVVNDGIDSSNVMTSLIDITATNDSPEVGAFDTTVTFTAAGTAVLLDANATVNDVDTTRFGGAVLTISPIANAEADDRLDFRQVTRLIGVSGSNVTYRGTTIGTLAGGVGTADLIVTFNASATESAVQTALRNVTYRSVSANPSTAARTVRVTLTDGVGGTSNLPTKTINVGAGPDAALLADASSAKSLSAASVAENRPSVTSVGPSSAADSEYRLAFPATPIAGVANTDNDQNREYLLSFANVDDSGRLKKRRRSRG